MCKNPFRRPMLAKMYDACLTQAHDNFSEFYYAKTSAGYNMGPCVRRRGAGHRHAFWNGYNGVHNTWIKDSLAYAAWRAGIAFKKGCSIKNNTAPE